MKVNSNCTKDKSRFIDSKIQTTFQILGTLALYSVIFFTYIIHTFVYKNRIDIIRKFFIIIMMRTAVLRSSHNYVNAAASERAQAARGNGSLTHSLYVYILKSTSVYERL